MEYIPLRMGARGSSVLYLQRILAGMDYAVGEMDGIFGVKTLRSVIAFQNAHELPVDGVVATNTWVALERHGGHLVELGEIEVQPAERPATSRLMPEIPDGAPTDTVPPPPPMRERLSEENDRPRQREPIVPKEELSQAPGEESEQTPPRGLWQAIEAKPKEEAPSAIAQVSARPWTAVAREVSVPEMTAAAEAIATVVAEAGLPRNTWRRTSEVN